MDYEIPVIDFVRCGLEIDNDDDLQFEEVEKAGTRLYEALGKNGFAYISNAGIPREQIDELNRTTQEFYSLPLDEKMKYDRKTLFKVGYDPLGILIANSERGIDFQEAFRVDGSFVEDETSMWPDVQNFKDIHIALMANLKKLFLRIIQCLGIGMKLKDPEILYRIHSKLNQGGNYTTLKTINYFPIADENTLSEKQIRTGEHSDAGSITLIIQDYNGGLQAQNPDGQYVDITPIPDTVVLIVGDCMEYWSGGRVKSPMHRVVPPRHHEKRNRIRRSIVYFGYADDETMLSRLEFEDGLLDDEGDTKLNKTTVKNFIQKRYLDYWPNLHTPDAEGGVSN